MITVSPDKLKEVLTRDGLITEDQFNIFRKEAERLGQNLGGFLVSRNVMTNDYFNRFLAAYLRVPLANLAGRQIEEELLNLITPEVAHRKRVIIFGKEEDGRIQVAMEDPNDLTTIEFLEHRIEKRVKPYLATDLDLNYGFSLYGKKQVTDFKKLIEENIRASLLIKLDEKGISEAAGAIPIVTIVDNLVSYAISSRASDIHIEILDDAVMVRFRIDGILHEIIRMPRVVYQAILARVKLLGSMKIDEHLRPQDGRFRYRIGGDMLDIRVSIISTFYGEKVEMRLLTAAARPYSIEELGMLDEGVVILKDNIKKTYGMILVTGPTGSGKTTTMYSVLSILNKPEVNIVTVEDPIEYDIKYINQTQINPQAGVTFANGLRAILRQDPNIIMVGEIRDEETASIAAQSALTGHLVLSSLHTNDAPTAIPRLIDMNIEPFLIAAVVNVVIAQRLVRKIHNGCIESYEPDQQVLAALERQMNNAKVAKEKMHLPKRLYRGKGCSADNFTGYQGRMAIYEIMNISEVVRRTILKPDFSLDELRKVAREEGMVTLFEDGLRKVERGFTTIEEVLRVIRE